jgi:uncharacterized protein YqfB (UPF0267 family)
MKNKKKVYCYKFTATGIITIYYDDITKRLKDKKNINQNEIKEIVKQIGIND